MAAERSGEMDWWVDIPKVELHAHLNGSIRGSTLLEFAKSLGENGSIVFADVEHAILKDDRTLTEVFKLFDLIHIVTTDHYILTRITKEVVEDFAAENVVYLELRTTPKNNPSIEMSKQSYMEGVIEGLRAVNAVEVVLAPHCLRKREKPFNSGSVCGFPRKRIYIGLLLSIDRRETTASAMETVELALQMRDMGVVGIDLSGNPTVGEWCTFLPALDFARKNGLRITLHCGEVPNFVEIQAMLDFVPERIGHACCFGEEEWKNLLECKIPVEICLTSNIRTETISSIEVHHFVDLYKAGHPIILCTDDAGIFSTSLSSEYILAASTFGLGKKEMFQLAEKAIEFTFAEEEVKEELHEIFDSAARMLDI